MRPLAILALVSCSAPAPKTPASELAYRLSHASCRRTCPVGRYLDPFVEPLHEMTRMSTADVVLADCCVDSLGDTWSSAAWDAKGEYMSPEQLHDPARLAGNCVDDSPAWPDCGKR